MPARSSAHAARRATALRTARQALALALLAACLGARSVPSFGFRDDALTMDTDGGDHTEDAAAPIDHCLNQQQDQGETDVDCGGSCAACAPGLGCIQNTDCDSSVCDSGSCSQPTCSDGVLNQDETERDCGGSRCPKCDPGQGCRVDSDCASNTCQAHACALTCLDGKGDCDGELQNGCEANLQTDALHCGDCATSCSLAHASAACSGGKCLVAECTAPFEDCDGDPTNGCETNTDTDPDSCGGCGMACVALNGKPACAAGACQITCDAGFADCDDSRANGCEIDLTKDTSHCSACDKTCSQVGGTANCVNSKCGHIHDFERIHDHVARACQRGGELSRGRGGVVNYGTGALAVKYNNVSMVLAKSAVTAQVWGGVFYLADSALPAAAGPYTISVIGGSFGIVGNAMELTGVDQTTPLDSVTSSVRNDGPCVSQSDTLAVTSDGALMYGVVAEYASAGDAGTASGSQTQVLDLRSTAMGGLAGFQTPVAAGSHSFPWSANPGCVSTSGALVALRAAVTL